MALTEGEEKEFIDGENIKKFIFHDVDIQEEILTEYLEQFGMKKDQKINFEQFCDILINDKRLDDGENKEKKIEENNNETKSENNNEKKIYKKVDFKEMSIIEIKEEYEMKK